MSGGEEDLWRANGGLCVVVARITEIRELPKPRGDGVTHVSKFEIIATLAGYLDPSETASLEVEIVRDPNTVPQAPRNGSLVIAVLQHAFVEWDEKRPVMCIAPAGCDFMPAEGSPVIVIKNLDDKRVAETLAAIRKARASGSGAAKNPSTQP